MGIFDTLLGKKKPQTKNAITSILPQEIYDAGVLELKDIIAPSALKITPREMNLGDKLWYHDATKYVPRDKPDPMARWQQQPQYRTLKRTCKKH